MSNSLWLKPNQPNRCTMLPGKISGGNHRMQAACQPNLVCHRQPQNPEGLSTTDRNILRNNSCLSTYYKQLSVRIRGISSTQLPGKQLKLKQKTSRKKKRSWSSLAADAPCSEAYSILVVINTAEGTSNLQPSATTLCSGVSFRDPHAIQVPTCAKCSCRCSLHLRF